MTLADELTGDWYFRAGAVDIEDGDQHWHADIDTLHHGGVVQCWGTEANAVALRDRILATLRAPEATDVAGLVERLVAEAWDWGHGCSTDDISDRKTEGDSYNESGRDDTAKAAQAITERIASADAECARLLVSRDNTREALEKMRAGRDELATALSARAAEIARLKQSMVMGFYEEAAPIYSQGEDSGHPELGSPITAEEANGLVSKITTLTAALEREKATVRDARSLICRAQRNMGPNYWGWHNDTRAFLSRNPEDQPHGA